MKTSYIIYDHISPSGKHYIGQTCKSTSERWGYKGSCYLRKSRGKEMHPLFANAIRKYGWNNFEHKILFTGLTKQDANFIEEDLIWYYKKLGLSYNITNGGEGRLGVGLSGSSNPFYGKHHTKDTLVKISASLKGRKPVGEKAVLQYSLDGTFIKEYKSAAEASRELNVKRSIEACCRCTAKTAYGFKWRYKDEN